MTYTCPLCNSKADSFSKLGPETNVLKCPVCGTQFIFPQPSDKMLDKIYNAQYFLAGDDPLAQERMWKLKRETAHLYLDNIMSLAHTVPGKLLEIGCGTGDFLLEAQSQGFDVSGLEISSDAVDIANNRLKIIVVRQGTLEEAGFEKSSFDLIALFDVIEHVRDPLSFLDQIYGLLKPGGKVAIVTPSLDSWSAKLMGRHWMDYKLEHLWYFNQYSIKRALIKSGFSQITFPPNYKILSLDYINLHFQRFQVPVITPIISVLRKLLPDVLAYHELQMVASGMLVLAIKQN